jgi:hypothetical protein
MVAMDGKVTAYSYGLVSVGYSFREAENANRGAEFVRNHLVDHRQPRRVRGPMVDV